MCKQCIYTPAPFFFFLIFFTLPQSIIECIHEICQGYQSLTIPSSSSSPLERWMEILFSHIKRFSSQKKLSSSGNTGYVVSRVTQLVKWSSILTRIILFLFCFYVGAYFCHNFTIAMLHSALLPAWYKDGKKNNQASTLGPKIFSRPGFTNTIVFQSTIHCLLKHRAKPECLEIGQNTEKQDLFYLIRMF